MEYEELSEHTIDQLRERLSLLDKRISMAYNGGISQSIMDTLQYHRSQVAQIIYDKEFSENFNRQKECINSDEYNTDKEI